MTQQETRWLRALGVLVTAGLVAGGAYANATPTVLSYTRIDKFENGQPGDCFDGKSQPAAGYSNGHTGVWLDFAAAGGATQILLKPAANLLTTSRVFSAAFKGCWSEKQVWLSPSTNYERFRADGHALGIDFGPTVWREPSCWRTMDKMMWNLRDKYNGGGVADGERIYFGFAFKVPDNFQAPEKDSTFLIYQLWQGSPHRPPLSLHVNAESNAPSARLFFELRQFATPEQHPPTVDPIPCLPSGVPDAPCKSPNLPRGAWVELIVGAGIDMGGPGGWVAVWRWDDTDSDYVRVLHKTGLTVGYAQDGEVNDTLQAVFGLYRTRQERRAKLFFDEVRVSTVFEDVATSP